MSCVDVNHRGDGLRSSSTGISTVPGTASFCGSRLAKHLIVDSSAFMCGADLRNLGEEIYTVPEVIEEIKDANALRSLSILPYELKVICADAPSIRKVTCVAKKSGDFYSLSATDIRLLALLYKLGCDHLGPDEVNTDVDSTVKTYTVHYPGYKRSDLAGDPDQRYDTTNDTGNSEHGYCETGDSPHCSSPQAEDISDLVRRTENLDIGSSPEESWEVSKSKRKERQGRSGKAQLSSVDFDRWITPDNIDTVIMGRSAEPSLRYRDAARDIAYNFQNSGYTYAQSGESKKAVVACCTSDYAIQNIVLLMRLGLVSPNGKLITRIRTYVLRCHGCYAVTRDFTKLFCPSCGGNTLIKTTAKICDDAHVELYLKDNFQYRTRGTIYPIPLPRSGRHSNNLILREGQREYEMAKRKKTIYRPPELSDSAQVVVNIKMPEKVVVGYGSINPNEVSRRRSRRKK